MQYISVPAKRLALSLLFFLSVAAVRAQNYQVTAIGFYNLENLFDTLESVDVLDTEAYLLGGYPYMQTVPKHKVDLDTVQEWNEFELSRWLMDPERQPAGLVYMDKRDDDFTSSGSMRNNTRTYFAKLGKLADVVSQLGTNITPDGAALLGVSEVEQISVLEDFVKQEAVRERNYRIIHHNSMDFRGIDVALLYQPKYFEPEHYKLLPVRFEEDGNYRLTRDVLWVEGKLNGEKVHVFVNHWPSRSGGEQVTRHKREAAAQVCKDVIDSLKKENMDVKVIVMGDLNDDPSSPSAAKVLQGEMKKESVSKFGMYNPFAIKHKKGEGTTAWRDAWSLFDQILVSPGLLREDNGLFFYKAEIFQKPFMVQKTGQYRGYPYRSFISGRFSGGYSDHFPVLVYLVKAVE